MPYDQNMRKGTRMHTVFEQFNLDTQSLPRLVESVRLTCQQSDNPIAAANALITSVGGEQLDTENPAFARLVASKLMQQTFMDTGLDQAAAVEHAATYLKNFPYVGDNTDRVASDLADASEVPAENSATAQVVKRKRKTTGGKKGAKRAVVVEIIRNNTLATRKYLISLIMMELKCSDTTASTHLYLAQKHLGVKSNTTKRGRGQAERARNIYVEMKAAGKSIKEIAAAIAVAFGITEAGAATHVYNARKMLGESTKRTRKARGEQQVTASAENTEVAAVV
jgi:hypothetical protein